jgi:gluconokinase
MGVAGSGKTTVAKRFAKTSGARFYEGDDYHPPANRAKMRAGIPLTDADRAPWLAELRKLILRLLAANQFAALTCSALKASYREQLAGRDPRVQFVHLIGSRTLLAQRLKKRRGHFLPPSLLDSQLAILEPPADALVFNCKASPAKIVADLVHTLDGAAPA